MIRVLIVDDHPVVRQGLAAALADQDGIDIAGAAGSAEEALALAVAAAPDVILLDLELPGASGLEALPELEEAAPQARVLVFTAYDGEERIAGSIRGGASGYLLKGASIGEITRAIHSVHEGGAYFQPGSPARVMRALASGHGRTLTPREREVLRLVAEGQSNKQVARSLGITERTAKFHLTSIFEKLEVDNRARAVAVALQRGLL